LAQETVVEVLAKFRADTAEFNRRLNEVQSQLDGLSKKTSDTSANMQSSLGSIGGALTKLGNTFGVLAGVAGGALISLGVSSFNAAARVQELDVAINAVGKSTGLGYDAINTAALGIKSMGIEMETAQRSALKFAQNNLKLEYASKLARVAQDMAVISGMNSTDTYNMLTHAVITGRSEVLKSVGIQKSAGQMYEEFARQIGKATSALSFQEKQQAVAEGALAEGAKVFGTYEAAMTSPGKVIRSFARITNDTKVAMGQMVLDGFGPMILAAYDAYKAFSKLIVPGGALYPIIEALTAVFTNLTQPLTDAITKFTDFASKMTPVKTSISDMGSEISKYLPVIASLGTAFATMAGQNLLRQVPIFGQLLGAINPVAAAIVVLIATAPAMRDAFMNLLGALKPLLPVLAEVGRIAGTVVNNAIYLLSGAINALAGFITNSIKFVKENSTAFKIMAGIAGMLAAAIFTVVAAIKVHAAVLAVSKGVMTAFAVAQVLMSGGQLASIASTNALAASMLKLNATMAANPIGLIVAAIAALVAGFVIAWNHSETFRKIMIAIGKAGIIAVGYVIEWIGKLAKAILTVNSGPLRLLLKGLALLKVPGAQTALDGITGAIDNVGKFFDSTSEKIKSYADNLDALENKRFKLPDLLGSSFKMPKTKETTPKNPATGLNGGGEDGGTDGAGAAAISALRETLQKYNDFINNEFVKGFQKDSSTARETVTKSLDLLKNIFDEKAKGLKGTALKNLQDSYWKINDTIRQFIPQAEEIGKAFEELNLAIEDATKRLEEATKNRADAAEKFGELLRKPFGEPSAITKAMGSAEATVDSIISMYDNLVEQINKRYDGIDPTGRDNLVNFLTNQTQRLVDLARRRVEVARKLTDAQTALDKITQEQSSFVSSTRSSMKSFATALVDLSKSDAQATIQVVKTASGLVITQIQSSSSGIDAITKQLRERFQSIKDFAANIKSLMERGVNKDYIRQLIEAGPEAAGAAASLMAGATDSQLAEINTLYSGIADLSNSFGDEMGMNFYGAAVKSAQALRDGYQSEMDSINAEMAAIVAAITDALSPLSDLGTNLGEDIAQGFLDTLNKRKTELVTLAESIATAIAEAMKNALDGIGVAGAVVPTTNTPVSQPTLADGEAARRALMKLTGNQTLTDEEKKLLNIGTVNVNVTTPDAQTFADDLPGIMSKALLGRR